jgi:hypothetical protein
MHLDKVSGRPSQNTADETKSASKVAAFNELPCEKDHEKSEEAVRSKSSSYSYPAKSHISIVEPPSCGIFSGCMEPTVAQDIDTTANFSKQISSQVRKKIFAEGETTFAKHDSETAKR